VRPQSSNTFALVAGFRRNILLEHFKEDQSQLIVEIISDSDPRISWHYDSYFGRNSLCRYPGDGAPPGAIGSWGECVARNYLANRGIFVFRHVVFRLPNFRVIADLFHPPTTTVYEVKTSSRPTEPNFRDEIWLDRKLVEEKMAKLVVYVHVKSRNSPDISESQKGIIRGAGFEILSIEGQGIESEE
jgi:hypothetical protein